MRFVGADSGQTTTGYKNAFIGYGAGKLITSGNNNTVLGAFSGNQGGLDIRTTSNNIVLSDGDGNPKQFIDSSGNFNMLGIYNLTTGSAANVHIASSGYLYRSTSSLRYKQMFKMPHTGYLIC